MPSFQFDAFVTVEADTIEEACQIAGVTSREDDWELVIDFREYLIDGEEPKEEEKLMDALTPMALHRIQVRDGHAVAGVRALIEGRLAVQTSARQEGEVWAIYFTDLKDVDLDFLRPDVLPPKDGTRP